MKDVNINSDVSMERSKAISRQMNRWRKSKKPKYYEEAEKRIEAYFMFCETVGMLPDVESLSLALGIHRTTFIRWTKGIGCSEPWRLLMLQAHQMISACIAEAGNSGTIPPLLLIWKQKSICGYKDNRSLEELPDNHYANSYTQPEQILQKYENLPELPLKADSDKEPDVMPAEIIEIVSEDEIPADPPEWLYKYARRGNA